MHRDPSRGWPSSLVGSVALLAAAVTAGCQGMPESGPERGRMLYENCVACHGQDGSGSVEFQVPAIGGLDAWYVAAQLQKFATGARGAHPEDIQGMRMRPMTRTLPGDVDVEAVAAYVATLPSTRPTPVVEGGDAARGRSLFETCKTCHGDAAQGDEAQGAPPLAHASDWYLVSQLQGFRAGFRGTNPADVRGAQMRPMAVALADDQAIKDVVAYISTLSE